MKPDHLDIPFCILTEEQYNLLKTVADILYIMTDNKNTNELGRNCEAIDRSLAFLCKQMDNVLDNVQRQNIH